MPFDIPREAVFPVDSVDIRLDPGPHPFECENLEAIRANWEAERQANPTLYDGEVVLLSRLTYADGTLSGRCHVVRFATFMFWRRQRPVQAVAHTFAHPMLVTKDNALVAIRSAQHTVNAGLVYFAAGSFEPGDFRDGSIDLEYNMQREVTEETGLDISRLLRDRRFHALSRDEGTVIFRRYYFDCGAEELAAKIDAHARACAGSEIDGAVVIGGGNDLPDRLAPHMHGLVEWHFANPPAVTFDSPSAPGLK